ncbi:MAG: carboxypeptidase-like regulatory domain-containing protein [Caldicoprobacter sp.]|uniref:carboxypeptidase-like regulatory domain-containing protein n=1 Tax=Caldicoprobacter sp. TaxID=2004500 RepID=UPI001DB75B02|nr:hypothetical protein [Clostridia bacterium]
MELQERICDGKFDVGEAKKGDTLESKSVQYNYQDLDQEQKVDVNPKQTNAQNIYIYVNGVNGNLAAKLTGVTYIEESKKVAPYAKIRLFFGHESLIPVYEANSDSNGNFVIEDLPPGYYTLSAEHGDLKYRSHILKILPAQIVHVSVLLK